MKNSVDLLWKLPFSTDVGMVGRNGCIVKLVIPGPAQSVRLVWFWLDQYLEKSRPVQIARPQLLVILVLREGPETRLASIRYDAHSDLYLIV